MENKRPTRITISCIIGFIISSIIIFISLGLLFTTFGTYLGDFLLAQTLIPFILFSIIYIIGLGFLWKMKKIGAFIYLGGMVIEFLILSLTSFNMSVFYTSIYAVIFLLIISKYKLLK